MRSKFDQAHFALGRLDSISTFLPDIPLFLYMYVRKKHHSNRSKGSQVLGEFVVLHTEEYADHNSAGRREKFLKSGQGRKRLDELESPPARGG